MIDFTTSRLPVRQEIERRLAKAWEHLARPGTWFTGAERVRLARVARQARSRTADGATDGPAEEVAARIAARPASTTGEWIESQVSAFGNEERYVEAMGISARIVMADTFARLVGVTPFELPEPKPGRPTMELVDPRPKKVRSWISVGPALVPPFTQVLVPDENDVTYPLIEALYMTGEDMEDPDFHRGSFHRTQVELVASVLSYGNECFY